MHQHLDNLGREAKDQLTGRSGVTVSVCFDVAGCIQFLLAWSTDTEIQQCWVDQGRLEFKGNRKIDSPWVRARSSDPMAGDTGSINKPLPGYPAP